MPNQDKPAGPKPKKYPVVQTLWDTYIPKALQQESGLLSLIRPLESTHFPVGKDLTIYVSFSYPLLNITYPTPEHKEYKSFPEEVIPALKTILDGEIKRLGLPVRFIDGNITPKQISKKNVVFIVAHPRTLEQQILDSSGWRATTYRMLAPRPHEFIVLPYLNTTDQIHELYHAAVVHEFGHALGLYHPVVEPDAPDNYDFDYPGLSCKESIMGYSHELVPGTQTPFCDEYYQAANNLIQQLPPFYKSVANFSMLRPLAPGNITVILDTELPAFDFFKEILRHDVLPRLPTRFGPVDERALAYNLKRWQWELLQADPIASKSQTNIQFYQHKSRDSSLISKNFQPLNPSYPVAGVVVAFLAIYMLIQFLISACRNKPAITEKFAPEPHQNIVKSPV